MISGRKDYTMPRLTRPEFRTLPFAVFGTAVLSLSLTLFAQGPPAGGGGAAQAPAAGGQGAPGGGPGGGAGRGGGGRGAVDPPGSDFLKRPPVLRQTPEVEQSLFLMQPGYKIELVASDPDIEDPVGVSFDGNGRMYVLEMRSYMRDADGSNSREPISRISRWEDTDGDGKYDKHTVFVDHMVMPRIAFPLQDGTILALETDSRDLYKYTDTNGDGVADKKELFYPNYGRVQNMEWQPGGMTWALDNWIYTTYNPFRLRIGADGKIQREETDPNGGQWGNAQDNYGKVWWVDGGGETGPVNFQTPIVYGAFNVPDNFEPDFQAPWSAPGGISDPQGGMNRVRLPDGTLNHFTAAAGPTIFRGDRLPQDLQGDLFFEEPVGRIVRRAKIVVTDGLTQLKNPYDKSEFIRSTDPLFRPVNIVNAPDGTMYLMDMYTGIIQDAQFVGPGSYLRRKAEQYSLDKQHNMGRIWRITHDSLTPDHTRPQMYTQTPAQLVPYLEHANGWWRDTAQKLLVLKQDKSVIPAVTALLHSSANQFGRFQALWTLEGLGGLTPAIAREQMQSTEAAMRVQAIRASETLYKAGDKSFATDYRTAMKDPDTNVAIQAMLTMNLLKVPDSAAAIQTMADTSTVRGIKEIGTQILTGGRSQGQPVALADTGVGGASLSTDDRRLYGRGQGTYRELCFTCHGTDGTGAPVAGAADGSTQAPPLAGSPRVTGHRDYIIKVLLQGLQGPIEGKAYNAGAVMVSMGANDDQWIADVATYVRNSFGNQAPVVTADQVAAVRKATSRKAPWTETELLPTIPAPLTNAADWKLTASHNTAAAQNATSGGGTRWDTGAAQQPGMWLQIELPLATNVTEVQLDSAVPAPPRGGGPGARGAGAGAAGLPAGTPGAGAAGRGAAGAPAGAPPAGAGGAAAGGAAAGRGGGGRGAQAPPASGPVGYSLQTSMDGKTWSAPLAQGAGATPTTTIAFKATQAKFIRITQTGKAAGTNYWAVQQVRVYQAGKAR